MTQECVWGVSIHDAGVCVRGLWVQVLGLPEWLCLPVILAAARLGRGMGYEDPTEGAGISPTPSHPPHIEEINF